MRVAMQRLGKVLGTAIVVFLIASAACTAYYMLRAYYYGSRELVTSKTSPELLRHDMKALDLYGQGNDELEKGELTTAEATFRRAIRTSGGSVNIASLNLYGLAQVLERQGRTQEAYVAYHNAFPHLTSPSPLDSDPLALARYARVCNETGYWEEALQLYGRSVSLLPLDTTDPKLAVRFDPSVPQQARLGTILDIMIGVSLSDHGADDEALTLLKETATKRPDCPLAQFYFAKALVKAGRPAEARAPFERAAQSGNGDVKAAAQRALMRYRSAPH